tara:strand:+ start:106 stop:1260 length:1155 start_codon:yes stop_codon:yes gene_type:complete
MDSYFCRKLVKDFRLRKFKNIGIFDIYSSEKSSESQENAIPKYNLLHKTLIDKGNIQVADNLLSSLLDNQDNKDGRFLLSLFMFTTFPEMINYTSESNKDSIEYNLFLYAKKLIRQLEKIVECENNFYRNVLILRFNYLYTVTNTLFTEFKKRDRLGLIEGLIVSYSEVEKFEETLQEGKELDSVTLQHIKIEKDKIMKRLRQLNGVEMFNQVRERKELIIERINNTVKENMEKAYWDSIKSNIDASPPNYHSIVPLLQQIIVYIDTILEYNKKYVEEIIETIDLEFLKQKIENGDINKFDIHDIIEYILDTFIELEPRIRTESNKKFKVETLERVMSSHEKDFSTFIIDFFKSMFSKFENLVTESNEYKKMPLISDIIKQKRA